MRISSASFLSAKWTILIMIIGLLIFAIYFYLTIEIELLILFFSGVNSIQFITLYAFAIVLVVLSVFFWALAWKKILEKLSIAIPLRKIFTIYWVGYFVDLVVPLERVGGDLVRVYMIKKHTKANYATLVSSTVTYRLVSYFVVMIGLIFAAVILVSYNIPVFILTSFFLIFAVALIYFLVLLYLVYSKTASKKLAALYFKLHKRFRPKSQSNDLEEKTQKSLAVFYTGFQPFRQNIRLLKMPFLYHAIAYFLRILVYVIIFYSLGLIFLPFAFFIAVYFVGSALQDAIGSFSVGSLDIFLVTLFITFGLDTGASGIAALLLRSADFWFPLVASFATIQLIGVAGILKNVNKKKGVRIVTGNK